MNDFPIFLQNGCSQPFSDEVQESSVLNALGQHLFQPVPPDVVEEAFDVGFHHKVVSAELQLPGQVLQRLVGADSHPISIAATQEVLFVYRQQDVRDRHLYQLV